MEDKKMEPGDLWVVSSEGELVRIPAEDIQQAIDCAMSMFVSALSDNRGTNSQN